MSEEPIEFLDAPAEGAGAAIVQATSVSWSEDGVLRVRTKDAAWQREVERSAALIRSRLGTLLGEQAVRYIEVKSV